MRRNEHALLCARAAVQAQRVKEEEARAEVEQHTFQPEISKLAQQIRQDEAECGGGAGTAYQRLYQRGATAKRQVRLAAGWAGPCGVSTMAHAGSLPPPGWSIVHIQYFALQHHPKPILPCINMKHTNCPCLAPCPASLFHLPALSTPAGAHGVHPPGA